MTLNRFFVFALTIALVSVAAAKTSDPKANRALARTELEKHLKLVFGEDWTNRCPLKFAFKPAPGEPGEKQPYTAFAKRVGDTVYFWGDDRGRKNFAWYGSLFAVYRFLDEAYGIRWTAPGDDGIVFKPGCEPKVEDGWKATVKAPTQMAMLRGMNAEYGRRHGYAQNRPFPYRHAFTKYFDLYFADHPEFFGMSPNGVRGGGIKREEKQHKYAKFCLSNPDLPDFLVARWKEGPSQKYFNICPNDGTLGYCYCENCRELDTDPPGERFLFNKTDRYLWFWRRLAEKAIAVNPDVTLVTYIYTFYRHPPRREKMPYPEHFICGYVPNLGDDYQAEFKDWRKAGLQRFFLRPNYLCYRDLMPRGLERFIRESYLFFAENGMLGFDYDGTPGNPSNDLEFYVLMRTMERPELSFETVCGEYYSQYGAAAPAAKAFFERIRSRAEAARARTAAAKRSEATLALDDTELAGTVWEYNSFDDIKGDLATLAAVDVAALDAFSARRFAKLKALAEKRVAEWEKLHAAAIEFQPKQKAWRETVRSMGYQAEAQESIKECLEKGMEVFKSYPTDKQERLRKSAAFRRVFPELEK